MKKVLIDTSIFISYYLCDDNYLDAETVFRTIEKSKQIICVSNLVLGETVAVLGKLNISTEEIVTILEEILNLKIEILMFNPIEWLDEIKQLASMVNLKSMDLFILTTWYINKEEYELLTLDSKLAKSYNKI